MNKNVKRRARVKKQQLNKYSRARASETNEKVKRGENKKKERWQMTKKKKKKQTKSSNKYCSHVKNETKQKKISAVYSESAAETEE